jgi:hypothetical protein
VAAATLIVTTAEITVFVMPYATRMLGISLRRFAADVLGRLVLPALVLAGLLAAGETLLPVTSLLQLIVVVGVALGGYLVAYLLLGADGFERGAYRSGVSATIRLASRPRMLRTGRSERL